MSTKTDLLVLILITSSTLILTYSIYAVIYIYDAWRLNKK